MTPRRPNKRNVKRKLDDLDPAEGDGYGGIWCRVTTAGDPDDPDDDGERYEPDRDPAPDDLVVEINHVEVPPADDEDGGIPAGKPTPDGGGKPDE
jgi:hypothetical protein